MKLFHCDLFNYRLDAVHTKHPSAHAKTPFNLKHASERAQPRTESNDTNLDFLIYFQSADDDEAIELAMPCRCFRQSHTFLLSTSEIFDHATQNTEQAQRRITNIFSTQRRSQCGQKLRSVDLILRSEFVILTSFCGAFIAMHFKLNFKSLNEINMSFLNQKYN